MVGIGTVDHGAAGVRLAPAARHRYWNGRFAASPPRRSASWCGRCSPICVASRIRRSKSTTTPGCGAGRRSSSTAAGWQGKSRADERSGSRRDKRPHRLRRSAGRRTFGFALGNAVVALNEWERTLPRRPAGGSLIAYPWHLVERNGEALGQDFLDWNSRRERANIPTGVTVLGPADSVLIDPAARVEPLVVLDATKGPVLIDRDAVVQAFSRLEGPCYVGPESHIMGAKFAAAASDHSVASAATLRRVFCMGMPTNPTTAFLVIRMSANGLISLPALK